MRRARQTAQAVASTTALRATRVADADHQRRLAVLRDSAHGPAELGVTSRA